MARLRWLALLILATLPLLSGCVILCGQRVSWFYDQPADELRILIHYDGIHDSDNNDTAKGAEKLAEFVKNGDVMLMDWVGHFQLGEWKKSLDAPDATPMAKLLAEIAAQPKVTPLGYYREPDGRIGAAQLVTIPRARDFVTRINRLINQAVVNEDSNDNIPRSFTLMKAVAAKDHAWLTLDGHSLRVVVPMDPSELAKLKGQFLTELFNQIVKESAPDADDNDRGANLLKHALASIPFSYLEADDRVIFVLGRPDSPSTIRLPLRENYQPNLEPFVIQTLLKSWDNSVVAPFLAAEKLKSGEGVSDLLAWGPPEQQVGALLYAASQAVAPAQQLAISRLKAFASKWNQKHAFPAAPLLGDDDKSYIAAWQVWYAKMKNYPLEP